MAYDSKKPKQKLHKPTRKELMKRDALAFAKLLCDIYKSKSLKSL